jgi:hypothetical protein
MRNSQRVVVGVIGAIAALIVVTGVWVRATAPEIPELSGERTTRTYDLTNFDGVGVSGQWQVTIERGDAWRVAVEAPTELFEMLSVRVEGDALDLGLDRWFGDFDDDERLEATITMPALESLDLSGASQVSFSGFDGSALSLDLSGASQLTGTASRFVTLTIDQSGAGKVDFADVTVTNASVDMSGAGNVTLRMAGGTLTGDMSGAGSLEYFGTVSEESVDTSGVANVRRRN